MMFASRKLQPTETKMWRRIPVPPINPLTKL